FWFWKAFPRLADASRDKVENRLKMTVGNATLRPGLVQEMFKDDNLGKKLKGRLEYQVELNWGANPPDPGLAGDDFSLRWQGYIQTPDPGEWTLFFVPDGGARLYVDGKMVFDGWTKRGGHSMPVTFTDQPHRIAVEYHSGVGNPAQTNLRWARPLRNRIEPIPMDAFFHDSEQAKLLTK